MKNRNRIIRILIYLVLLVLTSAGGLIAGLFDSVPALLDSINLRWDALLRVLIMALLVVLFENIIVLLLGLCKPRSHRTSTVITLMCSLLKYVAAVLILTWGLTIFGVDVSTVVASIGILALVVGFGAESIIADAVTGVFMLFENQYNVGDIVEIDGFRGTVRSIGIRSTSIEDTGGNIKIINNSAMVNILNRSNRVSRASAQIGIPYETDLESFEAQLPDILQTISRNHPDLFRSAPLYLGVESLNDSSITLLFAAEVEESDIYKGNRVLNHDLFLLFRKAGVELPYNQLDVHTR